MREEEGEQHHITETMETRWQWKGREGREAEGFGVTRNTEEERRGRQNQDNFLFPVQPNPFPFRSPSSPSSIHPILCDLIVLLIAFHPRTQHSLTHTHCHRELKSAVSLAVNQFVTQATTGRKEGGGREGDSVRRRDGVSLA
jgi:hypothetical protein